MKNFLTVFLLAIMMTNGYTSCEAKSSYPEDSTLLRYQDMLITMLSPHIDHEVGDYYSKLLTVTPSIYPYEVEIKKIERIGGFRTFDFSLTIEVVPVVGPHISVGKDRLTFRITPEIPSNQVRLLDYEHLETHELPSKWQHIIR